MVIDQVRDIAIIIIAVQSIVIGVLIAVLAFQVWRLVKMVQLEIKPILDDIQETVGTVRGTTSFVSNNVVEPVAKTSGYVAGMRRSVGVMQGELRATMNSFRRGSTSGTASSRVHSASTSTPSAASSSTRVTDGVADGVAESTTNASTLGDAGDSTSAPQ